MMLGSREMESQAIYDVDGGERGKDTPNQKSKEEREPQRGECAGRAVSWTGKPKPVRRHTQPEKFDSLPNPSSGGNHQALEI
jgi:hypothetical protein